MTARINTVAFAGIDVLDIDAQVQIGGGLPALINHFKGTQRPSRPTPSIAEDDAAPPDLKDVRSQETAKRALEVAAAGGHNLLILGPITATGTANQKPSGCRA